MYSIGSYQSRSSFNRVTGLSGFDTESVVKSLIEADKVPLTLAQQRRQITVWRQEAYRDVTAQLRGFSSTFFDVLKPATNMLSSSTIRALSAKTTSESHVRATASAGAAVGSHTIKVHQLATAAEASSLSGVTGDVSGTVSTLDLTGKSLRLSVDGVAKTLQLGDYTGQDIGQVLQQSIDLAFGAGKVAVSYDGGTLSGGALSFATIGGSSKLSVESSTNSGLSDLGLSVGMSNRLSANTTLQHISDQLKSAIDFHDDQVSFEINGKTFAFSKETTLRTVMDTINNDETAGVRMSYDEASDKLTLRAKQLGTGQSIVLTEPDSGFFASFGIDVNAPTSKAGKDAIVSVDGGDPLVRSTNAFSLNNVTYTLIKEHSVSETGETITVSQDVDGVVEKIRGFVEKYNEVLDMLNTKTTEKYDRAYMPLTDDVRSAMSEDQVKAWEIKAKTGLLAGDGILQNLAQKMRSAMLDAVNGVGLSLSQLGISSKGYVDKGKLTIDETVLRGVLESKPDQVAALLSGEPSGVPSYARSMSAEDRSSRYNQVGLFQRVSDLFNDHISTYRDLNGKKGLLLEKAGIEGDLSFDTNTLRSEIKTYDLRIDALLKKLESNEARYYKRFSAMESALAKMNSQSSWLMSQLGN